MRLEELARKSRQAAEVRAYQTHPDVAALRIERVRVWSAALIWSGVVLGLAFTMTNVQQFAARGAAAGSLPWLSAWLLDPMVSLVLIGVLLAEQVTSRWELETPIWARRTKWFALAATYVMNTWQPWATLSASGIVLHSVPPLLVFAAVEGGPAIRETLTKAVSRSLTANASGSVVDGQSYAVQNDTEPQPLPEWLGDRLAPEAPTVPAPEPVVDQRPRRSRKPAAPASKPRRTSRDEYLSRARDAHQPGITVTPAWVRKAVPGISRGTSQVVSDLLNAELATTPITPVATDSTVDLQGRAA